MTAIPGTRRSRISPLGLTFLVVTSIGWGVNFPIMKYLLSEWPPLSSRGLTGIVGAAALALIAMLQRQSLAVPRKMRLRLVLVSLLAITSWVALMGLTLLWLDAREAAVLAISVPVWVALLAWPVLGERLSLVRALALMVALGGIFILIGGNSIEAGIGKLPGVLLALAGAICVGLGTVLTKHFPLAVPPLPLAAWQIGIGCLPVAVAGLAIETSNVAGLTGFGWILVVYATVVQFCVAYVSWFAALSRLPASVAAIGTMAVPVIGVVTSAVALHEPFGPGQIAALFLTLAGVALAMLS